MQTSKRRLLSIIIALVTVTVSGCWDRREIENRGYVLGVAIDFAIDHKDQKQQDILYAPQGGGKRKYLVTMELPKFRKEESKEQASAQQHLLWAAEGESMFAITRAINTKVYFGMFFEDIQAMVFSEAVAREGIGELIDFWLRDAEIRRNVRLFVTPERAETILKSKLQVGEVNSTFIAKLTQNVNKSPYFSGKAVIGEISMAIREKRSFIMPIVMVEDKEVKLAGAAVFNKHQKMIGQLDEFDVYGVKMIRKEIKEGIIVIPNPSDQGKIAVFELYESEIKVTPYLEGDTLRFSLEAKFVGTLGENQYPQQDALDPAFTDALEDALAAEYIRIIYKAYDQQKMLRAEICGLGKLVYNKYPQYWETIQEQWDAEVFPVTKMDATVKVTVRRPVLTR